MKYNPHGYQDYGLEHILRNKISGLFMDMGLGKTVVSLTAVDELIYGRLEVERVLVIAPLRVADDTWSTEAQKWDHLRHLRISKVLGDEKKRKAALLTKADIYIINRELVAWLVGHYGTAWPFDMVIIDELSSFKSAKSTRFKALKTVRPLVDRIVGLTGTPAPNSLLDLWPQMYLLDMGERLGKSLTKYRETYFRPVSQNGFVVYKYGLRKDTTGLLGEGFYEKEIYSLISDVCVSMRAIDYLKLPEKIERDINIKLSPATAQKYKEFEKTQVLRLLDSVGGDVDAIAAVNAAALTNKLLQFANGAVYDEDRKYHAVHDDKLDALEDIVELANGSPVLVFYSYRHDLERIQKRLEKYRPEVLDSSAIIEKWNAGNIPVLIAHPAGAGHGLNLQAGGNTITWFGLPWSLELYLQANARLYRQGQTSAVIIHRLLASGTMDVDVLAALDRKQTGQEALLDAVKARIRKYLNR